MQFELLRIAVALASLSVAAYYDIFNRRNVPVAIPYSMIGAGVLLNLATLDVQLLAYSSATALFVFALGYLVYRAGQIGGADILIFAALAIIFPAAPSSLLKPPVQLLFEYPFVASVFVLSGLLSIFGIGATYVPRVIGDAAKGQVRVSASAALSAAILFASFLAVLYALGPFIQLHAAQMLLTALILLLAAFLILFKEHITSTMTEWVPLSQIDEEDVVALERLDSALVSKFSLQRVATRPELAKLGKTGLKKFPVLKGMPAFVPYILLAVILLLIFGDPLWLLLP